MCFEVYPPQRIWVSCQFSPKKSQIGPKNYVGLLGTFWWTHLIILWGLVILVFGKFYVPFAHTCMCSSLFKSPLPVIAFLEILRTSLLT